MANKNERGSWKAKVVAIAALLAAIALGTVAYLDGDDETDINMNDIVEAGQDVKDQFIDDTEAEDDSEPEG